MPPYRPARFWVLEGEAVGEGDALLPVELLGRRDVKLEPRMRSIVPGVRLEFSVKLTLLTKAASVRAAGRSAAEAYSITDFV